MLAAPPEYSAFISYANADNEKAEEICDHLEAQKLRCWIAPRDVRAGKEYANEIIIGIERSRCLVLLLSKAANGSQFVKREVERAVTKGRPVIPVRIEDVLPSPGLELFVSSTHWIDAFNGPWSDDMDQLVRAVTDAIATASPGRHPAFLPDDGDSQWGVRRILSRASVVVLIAALAGIAYRYGAGEAARVAPITEAPSRETLSGPGTPAARTPDPPERPAASAGPIARESAPPGERTPPAVPRETARPVSQPPARTAVDAEMLEDLRQQGTRLALRAQVVDGSLERLAEQMRPNGLRGDIVLRQKSAASSLAAGERALERENLEAARRFFEQARMDVDALESFLGR